LTKNKLNSPSAPGQCNGLPQFIERIPQSLKIALNGKRRFIAVNNAKRPPEITEEIKKSWPRSRFDYSSGGVAIRRSPENGDIEVALISTRGGSRWQLPKGSNEAGETSSETALREVKEEVGLLTEVVSFLDAIEFWYWDTYRKEPPELVHKRVDFFLLRIIGGTLSDASHEVDGVAWRDIKEAAKTLTFDGERRMVALAIDALTNDESI
jgi:8-oxo-dGTP pyrophosphatase MutT (NUDIX family)